MKKQVKGILGISSLIFIVLLIQLIAQNPPPSLAIDFEKLADFGTSIGGIFGFVGIIILYMTLINQAKTSKQQSIAFQRTQFEGRVFELLRYHRENVETIEMRDPNSIEEKFFKAHKVFREIYRQFGEVMTDVQFYLRDYDLRDFYKDDFSYNIEVGLLKEQGVKQDVFKIINEINISYLTIFFGLDKEGRKALEEKLSSKYEITILKNLLDHLSTRYVGYSKKATMRVKRDDWKDLQGNRPFKGERIKFHGGHQYRLSHYFRHLFQTISFIDEKGMSHNENYGYGKVMRAQLSTFEQKLLFINSLSDLGRPWELKVGEKFNKSLKMDRAEYVRAKAMMTKYNMVRSIPNSLVFINITDVYPNLIFDGNKSTLNREELDLLYSKGYY